jgi:hypothetical protein
MPLFWYIQCYFIVLLTVDTVINKINYSPVSEVLPRFCKVNVLE